MKLFLSLAVALLTINRGTTSECPPDADNGTDVNLTLNCATNNPIVSYQLGLDDYFLYGHVIVEYTCTNSSSSIVASGTAISGSAATSESGSITPTLASGVQCTFSGCYVSTITPKVYSSITTIALQPTPCIIDIDECSRGLDNCHVNAVCENTLTSFICECKFGYEGDGLNCTNIDECLTGANNCSDDALCADTNGGYNCTCKRGFEGDGFTCSDIDECWTANCSVNATCSDFVGGYNCTCNSGFEGDGVSCTNVNECDQEADCDTNAECTDTEGSYECHCNHGYSGDGFACTNINECESDDSNNCHENANCTNTEGSYTCSCNPGYTGNGVNCTNVNECELEIHTCNSNANCTDTNGSFNCACEEGFEGDGFNCTDINECESDDSNNCHENAQCTNTEGSYTCSCKPGYTGDGVTCTNIDECESDDLNNCHENAQCTNTEGSFTCSCNSGYTGDGVTCTNINECELEIHTCNPNATCNDTDGSFNCACREGFEGDGLNCTDIPECERDCHPNANCTNTSGSYVCICNTGLTGDGFTCTDTQMLKVAVTVVVVIMALVFAITVAAAVLFRKARSCEVEDKPFPLAVILKDEIDPDFNPISIHTLPTKPGSVVSIINILGDSRSTTSTTFETSSAELDQLEEFSEAIACSKRGSNTQDLLGSETSCSRNKEFQMSSITGARERNLEHSIRKSPQIRHTFGIQQSATIPVSTPTQQEAIHQSLNPEPQLSSSQMKQPVQLSPLLTSCTLGETDHTCLDPTLSTFPSSVLLSPTFPTDDSGFYQDSEGYIKNNSGSEVNSGTVTPKKKDRDWTDSEITTRLALLPLSVCYNAQTIQRMQLTSDEEEGYMETRISQEESS